MDIKKAVEALEQKIVGLDQAEAEAVNAIHESYANKRKVLCSAIGLSDDQSAAGLSPGGVVLVEDAADVVAAPEKTFPPKPAA